ncbi:MAG: hypothetical protein ABFC57_08240 [Veillonellales bacterium]
MAFTEKSSIKNGNGIFHRPKTAVSATKRVAQKTTDSPLLVLSTGSTTSQV